MALNSDGEQKSNLVLRVDQDSDSVLQSLFDTVLKPDSKRPLQVPLRMRQLPKSFFNPPSTGSKSPSVSHSRENSADSAFGSSAGGGSGGGSGSSVVSVSHSRAHSSPASLQQTYTAGAQQGQQPPLLQQHVKQRSYDVGPHLHDDLGPLPPGWEQARTPEGQIYYLNHTTKTTTWEDPRKSLAAQTAAAGVQHQSDSLLAQAGQALAATAAAKSASSNTTSDPLGPLPDGWEQATTPEGEIYFINHAARTTSWFDPRIPQHLQRTPSAAAAAGVGGWAGASLQACQQKLRLQSLQLERERLKQRQQEIKLQQELIMARQASSLVSSLASSGAAGAAVAAGAGATATDLQLDPFLSGLSEHHQRQESADSGLGMAVSHTYSMPHTPEDFLAGMDDRMDCTSETGVEMALVDNIDATDDLVPSLQILDDARTGDPRVIQRSVLGEFTNDILDDVQSLINSTPNKPDNVLTWL